jgi:hypothetical protein
MNATSGSYENKLLRYVLTRIKSGIVMHDYLTIDPLKILVAHYCSGTALFTLTQQWILLFMSMHIWSLGT